MQPNVLVSLCLWIGVTDATAQEAGPRFTDVASEAGVDFQYHTGSRGQHDLVEIMGGGVALFDADGDGLLDIFVCDGCPIDPQSKQTDPPCRLFRNRGGFRFEDVTGDAGAPGPAYAMGAATGDFDGDGRVDLFVTGWRDQRLYRNMGGCRFRDVTAETGLNSTAWSTSAAFADLDGDGDIDIYVCNYLDFDGLKAPFCAAPDGRRDYCGPEVFASQRDRLYRNEGNSTFTEVSEEAGILDRDGRGLGVLVWDFDGDGRLDLFVANDGTAAFLWHNEGRMRFRDAAEECGLARDARGEALAGMGVAWGDINSDGLPDLIVSNYLERGTVGFRGLGDGQFVDASEAFGLGCTREVLGFGLGLADFDGDGDLDLLQANGHVVDRARLGLPFAMKPMLLQNVRGRFADASRAAGPWFEKAALGRGMAIGDLDRDGRPDAIVAGLDRPLAILRNISGYRGVGVELVPRRPGGSIGARVELKANGRMAARQIHAGGSYLSASPDETYFPVGDAEVIDELVVAWATGEREAWRHVMVRPLIRLDQGSGETTGPAPRVDGSNRPR